MSAGGRYPLRWKFEKGDFAKAELKAGDYGGTDAAVLISILREDVDQPFHGAKSFLTWSVDGATGKAIPRAEIFQAPRTLKPCRGSAP